VLLPLLLGQGGAGPATQTLLPGLVTNGQTFFSPTVSATRTLAPALYSNAQTFYSPTAAATYALTPGLYTNIQTFYASTVTQSAAGQGLLPGLYTNTQTFYSATAASSATLAPALYTNPQTFYASSVTTVTNLVASLFTNTQTFYSPTVVVNGGPQTLAPELLVNQNTFLSPVVQIAGSDELQRGESWMPQMARKRKWSEDRDEREALRKAIEQAIDPITETQAKVVTVKGEVAIVTESRAIALPVPPQFDAQAVARMAVSVLEKAGIEAQRVRDAENRRRALLALEAERVENERRLRKRRRDEEILLLM